MTALVPARTDVCVSSFEEGARWPFAALKCLTLAMVVQLFAIGHVTCDAEEPPNPAELKRAHLELRAASRNVQGTIQVFRSDEANAAAFEKPPADLGIPLVLSGHVWRSEKRFRADYDSHPRRGVGKKSVNSVAMDGGTLYSFTSTSPHNGVLRVCNSDTRSADDISQRIDRTFNVKLDAHWSDGQGGAFVDLLQKPGTKVVPNTSRFLRGGYSLLVPLADDNNAQVEFAPSKNYPFGYIRSHDGQGDRTARVEQLVLTQERGGVILPTRIVNVYQIIWNGKERAETEVVVLNLKPLEPDSPIAGPITTKSFRNLGTLYRVHRVTASGIEEMEEIMNQFEIPLETLEDKRN